MEANRHGRTAALALMTLFGLTMLLPTLAARMPAPIVSIGCRLATWAGQRMMAKGTAKQFSGKYARRIIPLF